LSGEQKQEQIDKHREKKLAEKIGGDNRSSK
jgi:hypothetical protein